MTRRVITRRKRGAGQFPPGNSGRPKGARQQGHTGNPGAARRRGRRPDPQGHRAGAGG